MDIKWCKVYGSIGKWVDKQGDTVKRNGNFHCEYKGQKLICIMTAVSTPAGHGEPSMVGFTPKFYDKKTLEFVNVNGLVTVTEN